MVAVLIVVSNLGLRGEAIGQAMGSSAVIAGLVITFKLALLAKRPQRNEDAAKDETNQLIGP